MRYKFIFTILLTLLFSNFGRADEKDATEVQSPLKADAQIHPYELEAHQIGELKININLPDGYKAYEDQLQLIAVEPQDFQLAKWSVSPVKEFFDKFSGKSRMGIFGKAQIKVAFEVPDNLQPGESNLLVRIKYQACTESKCLFPSQTEVQIPFKYKGVASSARPLLDLKNIPGALEKNIFLALFFVFIAGILTSFTPCILPMVPITLAILGRQVPDEKRKSSFLLSLFYVFGIATTYSILGVVAASTGALFGSLTNSPFFLGLMCLFFIFMALSLFGVFEINIFTNTADRITKKLKLEGYPSVFVYGLISGIVASPCVGPVLVSILTLVANTKNIFYGFILLFFYAMGMGQLFLLIGVSSQYKGLKKFVPKTGNWMRKVNVFLGVCMLGVVVYYGNLLYTQLSPASSEASVQSMSWTPYTHEAFQDAIKSGKPTVIDFRADWCAACKELENLTYPDKNVQARLQNLNALVFDATKETSELTAMKEKYNLVGLPTLIFFSPQGELMTDLTLTEFEDASKFAARLDRALSKK